MNVNAPVWWGDLDVPCPRCKAAPGNMCRGFGDTLTGRTHLERTVAALLDNTEGDPK